MYHLPIFSLYLLNFYSREIPNFSILFHNDYVYDVPHESFKDVVKESNSYQRKKQ